MADLTTEDRIKLAVQFIAQSPPGEVNDVIQDIAAIIGDNDALTPHVAAALKEYNLAQMTTVEHAAEGEVPAHVTLLSDALVLPGNEERYIDHEGKRSFAFDHVRLVPTNYEPYVLPAEDEAFRAALAASLLAYAKNHFVEGCASVSTNQVPEAAAPAPAPAELEPEPQPEAETESVRSPSPTAGVADLVVESPTEQPGSGTVEQVSTPGREIGADDEVDVPGGEEKLDEEIGALEHESEEQEEKEEAVKRENAVKAEDSAEVDVDDTVAAKEAEAKEAKMDEEDKEDKLDKGEAQVGDKEETGTEDKEEAATEVPSTETEAPVAETVAETSTPAPETAAPPAPTLAPLENPLFVLEIVGNRYKANNFWTGRWRTRWTVDRAAGSVTGVLHIDVHYYEQGNVQLSTTHNAAFACPAAELNGQSIASQIVTAIAKVETNYQLAMTDVYEHMNGSAFRSLRRALPVTRQKLDWDKVQGYALGADLSRARA